MRVYKSSAASGKVRLCVCEISSGTATGTEMGVHKNTEHESGYFEDENSDDDGVCGRRVAPAAVPLSTCDALNNNVQPGHDCCHAIRPAVDRGMYL